MISGWKPTLGYLCGFYGVSVLGFCCETQEEREAFERERNAVVRKQ